MPAWKVLLVGFFAVLCVALVTAMMIVMSALEGNEMWGWLGGLGVGTIVTITLFVIFLKSASKSLEGKTRK
jgi:hypothetical protein